MDNQRYDKNADQLSQILWHYTKLQRKTAHLNMQTGNPCVNEMVKLLTKALQTNDDVARLQQKGLI